MLQYIFWFHFVAIQYDLNLLTLVVEKFVCVTEKFVCMTEKFVRATEKFISRTEKLAAI